MGRHVFMFMFMCDVCPLCAVAAADTADHSAVDFNSRGVFTSALHINERPWTWTDDQQQVISMAERN